MTYLQARDNLANAVRIVTEAMKTQSYYKRVLNRAVLQFYRGDVDAFSFIDTMIRLIDDQFRRAWNEGARAVGYDPEDMTQDDLFVLLERQEQEKEYILNFASGIESARLNDQSVKPFQNRAAMWANRYNEIRDWAKSYFGGQARLEWVLGPTEHCESCLALEGTVAPAYQWEEARAAGIYPKSKRLQCGGYNCQCSLQATAKPLTPGNIPSI